MLDYSPGALLAWRIGSQEAVVAHQEFLEREQLMIGVLKLEPSFVEEVLPQLGQQFGGTEYLRAEVKQFNEFCTKCNLKVVPLRRKLRELAGTGTFTTEQDQREVVHRSAVCKQVFEQAGAIAQQLQSQAVNILHLLAALMENPGPAVAQALVVNGSNLQALRKALKEAMAEFAPVLAARGPDAKPARTALGRFGVDLTQQARDGKLEPLIGRKHELLQMERTLGRKTKNNPLLLGDPGVGKTAIVRGLACRIASGAVGEQLKDKRVIELSMGSLVAGTKYRGEFEERLTQIMEETRKRPEVILFLDEIHTLVGAGAGEGALDAANMLKPALASGELSCIGSTTVAEYRKSFEKDAALARRFQPIFIEEPSAEDAVKMLEGAREAYEKHHGVRIAASALRAAVELSARYVPDRHLPDKAFDLLDEACTRVKVASVSLPKEGGESKTPATVTADIVAQVVTEWTGIPVARMAAENQKILHSMAGFLAERVIGQENAIERVVRVIQTAKSGLRDKRRPNGVFLFLGPTGVGKTELSKAVAEFLFGSSQEIIRLDMSEYMEKHTVSRLIGAPPGYIGHDQEGELTGKLRRKPYSVVLLDEIEKAHANVFDLFLQLFDEGRLTDSHGRTVDGKHAIYIMTSNITAPEHAPRGLGFLAEEAEKAAAEKTGDALTRVLPLLKGHFRPEFLNRIDEIVIFGRLTEEHLVRIAHKLFAELSQRALEQQVVLEFADEVAQKVSKDGYSPEYGARPLERALERLISRPLGELLLGGQVQAGDTVRVTVVDDHVVFTTVPVGSKEGATS